MSDKRSGLVYNQSTVVMRWVAANIDGCERGWDQNSATAIGVILKGELIAGVVYHDWNPEAGVIELSTYANDPRWLTRKNIFLLLYYAFKDVECQMVVTRTKASNHRTVKLLRGLGFSELRLKRLFGRCDDGLILTLTDDDWKNGRFYMRSENGKT